MFAVISGGLTSGDIDQAIKVLDHVHDRVAALATLEEIRAAKVEADAALHEANVARAALSETCSSISRRTAELDEREARLRSEEAALLARETDLTRREKAFRDACHSTIAVALS